ncbi:sensor domain-containing diguanylate cyclase [Vreelandella massiliensis]|uniref:sensor domain-containing diguanylate cyclase n=1 Tax=Vreelandella massiliensis TaxID=1816686 RepID=UPI001181C620|nr:sensor domain-containing diguanylate cyclase [Halomonas massiliensis]
MPPLMNTISDFLPADDNMSRMIHAAPIGVCATNADGYFMMVNQAYCEFYGYQEKELLGQHFTMVVTTPQRKALTALHDKCFRDLAAETSGQEWEVQRKDGSRRTILAYATIIAGQDGKPYKITYINDITDRKRLENRLDYLAHHDELTGLLNRRAGLARLTSEKKRCHRYGTVLCIAILDIDHFKRINDTHGHDVGDDVLVEFAHFFMQGLRNSDSAVRLGGEEFMLIMPGIDKEEARQAIARVCEEIRVMRFSPRRLTLTFSAGVAQCGCDPSSKESNDTLIKRADDSLYRAKNLGRDTIIVAP